jgi:hypothetical protein
LQPDLGNRAKRDWSVLGGAFAPVGLQTLLSMVTYEVSANVEESLREKYERYMIDKHLHDVLATSCFVDATLERAAPGKYRIRYRAEDDTALDRYLRNHTAALRKDFAEHFPAGVELSREVWTEVAVLVP